MSKFRLYIDECGTHNYSKSDEIDKRYLGLTGVIVNSEVNEKFLQPKIIKLKKIVADDADELPILHRIDIVGGKGVFKKLNISEIKSEWDNSFLNLIKDVDFSLCAVVLDKKAHLEKYQNSAYHPYSYCLNVLLERYVKFLEKKSARGDVLAEARGQKEDDILRKEYRDFYDSGTYYLDGPFVRNYLTSNTIKIKPKKAQVTGLELADSLALATKLDVLFAYKKIEELKDNFNKKIIGLIQAKYDRNTFGRKKGCGKKFI